MLRCEGRIDTQAKDIKLNVIQIRFVLTFDFDSKFNFENNRHEVCAV